MTAPAIYLSEADVAQLVDLDDAIDSLEDLCARQANGEALEIPKALATFGDGASLHALGSGMPSIGLGGFKTWINTKLGAMALMNVFDLERGSLAAVIEAGTLGQLRTAGISGVATRWLAAADANEMALIGSGRQAILQIAAVAAVRPLKRLRVFSPTPERRQAFVAKARSMFGFPIDDCPTLTDAVHDSPIVTLVTRAREPFLRAADLTRGAHLNAVGAILPANAEFHQDVFVRASLIVVDSLAGVRHNSREFIDQFGPNAEMPMVKTLGQIINQRQTRPATCDISLFKAMGMGISDLAVARLVIAKARERGIGQIIAAPKPAAARWRPQSTAAE